MHILLLEEDVTPIYKRYFYPDKFLPVLMKQSLPTACIEPKYGACRLATAYSIIGTCIKNGINVRNYLNYVLAEFPKRMSKTIDDLLPMNWNDPAVII